jgi:hypothetical protein
MSASLCNAPLSMNPLPPTGLGGRLQALWRQLRQASTQARQAEALKDLSGGTLRDLNAPDWLRRDVLHHAEMEHYDRMRTLSQFRGLM